MSKKLFIPVGKEYKHKVWADKFLKKARNEYPDRRWVVRQVALKEVTIGEWIPVITDYRWQVHEIVYD